MSTPTAPVPASRALSTLIVVAGALGTLASAMLTYDRIETLANPAFVPACSLNSVLSCTDVMDTWQGNLLGFPNMLLGIPAFAVLLGLGLALLGGAALPRRLWLGLQAGVTAAFGFVVWLITQCLYVIGALCPWCMLAWAVVLPLFWYVTTHCVRTGILPAPAGLARSLAANSWAGPVVLYGTVLVLVLTRFGDRLF
ncbi:vitamin K epoxide reductase family protein [Streptomyces sp. TRM66268-LWL]|uniref:Vitamin K epoxide reductase family protein n=1 Tax=Streptomyces polyasparticus TaxID=2767826 RepID=A0ABR7SP24_9ACTN|nr:vitamin K epoxide reductase family protein [Streptomyces polyasparticus]MBC9716322.1 vitamin K epoxide reductase family protein [Streptomyces polyasparticus]